MTRPLRIEFKGAVHHITSGGNARQAIFLDEKDFTDFLRVLGQVVKRYYFILPAYCLINSVTRSPLDEILKHKDKKSKNQAIYKAHLQYDYTLKDIAEYIGVHYTKVSRAIKKIEGEDEK